MAVTPACKHFSVPDYGGGNLPAPIPDDTAASDRKGVAHRAAPFCFTPLNKRKKGNKMGRRTIRTKQNGSHRNKSLLDGLVMGQDVRQPDRPDLRQNSGKLYEKRFVQRIRPKNDGQKEYMA